MKIASVLDYLKDDSELVTMLDHKRTHPKITAYKSHDKNAYPYVVVKMEPFTVDMVLGQHRCEVRLVTNDTLAVEGLTDQLINRLHFGNQPSVEAGNNLIYNSTHAGGSLVFDEDRNVFEQVLFFNIIFSR